MCVTKEVRFIKDVYWDNWGKLVRVFLRGDVVEAKVHEDGNLSAESTLYRGILDAIYPEDYEEVD